MSVEHIPERDLAELGRLIFTTMATEHTITLELRDHLRDIVAFGEDGIEVMRWKSPIRSESIKK